MLQTEEKKMKKYLFIFIAAALGLFFIVSSAQARSGQYHGWGGGVVFAGDSIRIPLPPFPFFLPPPPPFFSVGPSYDCDYRYYRYHRPQHRDYHEYYRYHDGHRRPYDRQHRPHNSYRHRDWYGRGRY
jgi:hypothetical protein